MTIKGTTFSIKVENKLELENLLLKKDGIKIAITFFAFGVLLTMILLI